MMMMTFENFNRGKEENEGSKHVYNIPCMYVL